MKQLRTKARELLQADTVKAVIGYQAGSRKGVARPTFITKPEQADTLILDDTCVDNLAVYLLKPEVKALGRPAVVAQVPTLRTILQLAAENQLTDGQVLALDIGPDGSISELADFAGIEAFVAKTLVALTTEQEALLTKIEAMPRAERWAFWQAEFSRCIKCYACRQACPMCYCSKCIVETNQPQWIPVAPHDIGNLEWHIVRAMHLAGRCLNCGFCASACPMGIPLNLLTQRLAQVAAASFGAQAGTSATQDYVLSTFKPDDKEGFIR